MYANKNDAYLWVSEYFKHLKYNKDGNAHVFKTKNGYYSLYENSLYRNIKDKDVFIFTIPASKEDFFTLLKILDK